MHTIDMRRVCGHAVFVFKHIIYTTKLLIYYTRNFPNTDSKLLNRTF